jgi:HEAT repeat protein
MTAEDPLSELLVNIGHKFPAVRLRAARALGKLAGKARTALPPLAAAADDADPKVREAAVQSLSQLGPDAVPALAKLLGHSDKYVRRNAVWGLGRLAAHARPVVPDICRALKDEDPRTASGAAQALGAMGPAAGEAVPALAEAMRGTNIVLCRMAAKALSQIGRPALSTLIQHLRHHDPFVRGEAAVGLGWMGPTAAPAVVGLIDVLRTTRPPGRRPGLTPPLPSFGTPPTAVIAKPADPPCTEDATRAAAAQALGRIGPEASAALADLTRAMGDESESVRKAAELAVKQIQGEV